MICWWGVAGFCACIIGQDAISSGLTGFKPVRVESMPSGVVMVAESVPFEPKLHLKEIALFRQQAFLEKAVRLGVNAVVAHAVHQVTYFVNAFNLGVREAGAVESLKDNVAARKAG